MRGLLLAFLLLAGPALAQPISAKYGPGDCPFGASACQVKSTGSTTPISLANRFSDVIYAKDYGVVCDTNDVTLVGTDNTTTLAAAIAAAQTGAAMGAGKRLVLPSGLCLAGPQTVTGQIDIEGSSSASTVLVLKTGSNAPMITVQTTGYNFPADGHPAGEFAINNLRITSVDGKATNASHPLAAGISFADGVWALFAHSEHVTIYNMPGDGVDGGHFGGGFANLNWLYCHNNGGYGVSLNTTADWILSDSSFDLNGKDGLLSSGDAALFIFHLNSYSNTLAGVHLFGRDVVTFSGHNSFDRNGTSGLSLDHLTSGAYITASESIQFGGNSASVSANYSAVNLTDGGGAGTVTFAGQVWPAPFNVDGGNPELYNIQFGTGVFTTQFYCYGCVYLAGTASNTWVTNTAANLHSAATNGSTGWDFTGTVTSEGPLTVNSSSLLTAGRANFTSATQFSNASWSYGANSIALIRGFAANGDVGEFELATTGTTTVRFGDGGWTTNFINADLWLGNNSGSATPAGKTLRATDGLGTNIAGGNLGLSGGRGTGTGIGGDLIFYGTPAGSTGTTLNTNTEQMRVLGTGGVRTGAATLTLTTGAVGLSKMTASASAPGAGGGKLELVCGTNAGTAKLIISAGTSATAVTITDNIGAGVTGC